MLSVFLILLIANVLGDSQLKSKVDKIYGDKLGCAQDSGKIDDYLDNFAFNVNYCDSLEQYGNGECKDKDTLIQSISTNWAGQYDEAMLRSCQMTEEDEYSRSIVVECDSTLITKRGCTVKSISYDICSQIRSTCYNIINL